MPRSNTQSTRRGRFAAVVLAVVVGPAAVLAGAGVTAGAETETSRDGGRNLDVRPGRIGPAKAGMTVNRAMRTDLFRRNVPNPPCGRIPLQPKGKLKRQFDAVVVRGHLIEMGVFGRHVRTPKGAGVGTKLRRLRNVYPGLSRPRVAGYDQWAVYLTRRHRHLGFLLGKALVDEGRPRPSDKVTFMAVTRGKRPQLIRDGC